VQFGIKNLQYTARSKTNSTNKVEQIKVGGN